MQKTKLRVEVDQAMQDFAGLRVESCSAFYDADENKVHVFAEIVAEGGVPVDESREFNVALYDDEGTLIETASEIFLEFGLRRMVRVTLDDVCGIPVRAKVFPAT